MLQEAYKAELAEAYGISFNGLLCLNNMPIKRYVDYLQRKGQLADYMQLLLGSFNAAAAEAVMCRGTVSVGWDGRVYDCDFNQQLELGLRSAAFLLFSLCCCQSFLELGYGGRVGCGRLCSSITLLWSCAAAAGFTAAFLCTLSCRVK